MEEKQDKKEHSRREYLAAVAAGASLTGCLGPQAPELRDRTETTENRLKTELPWNRYDLEFDVEELTVDLEKFQPTGVENAYQYGVVVDVPLSDVSNDLRGYTATEQRQEEFFFLYAQPSFDMLLETYDNFQEFTPPNQPSHRNQVTQYGLHVDAEKCSYIEDRISGPRMDDILQNPESYLNYLDGGESVETVVDDGEPFGLGLWC